MDSDRLGTVYTLTDPRNGLVRYVGATTYSLPRRLSGHIGAARRGSTTRVAQWLRELLDGGLRPTATALHVVREVDLAACERQAIERHYDEGWPLTNVRDFPGAFHAYNSRRKLTAAHRRAERLAGIGGPLLGETVEEIERLEADMRELEARSALAALRNPTDEEGFEAALWLLLRDWNAEPIGYTGAPPASDYELERLVSILLELAVVANRRGVEFSHIASGVGRRLLREVRWGALFMHGEPDSAA